MATQPTNPISVPIGATTSGSLSGPPPLAFDLRLEMLKLIHASTLARWTNRRDYEWKLSYAFWTALAGFIATVSLGKDSKFTAPPEEYLIGGLVATVLLHAYYLIGMVNRTLQDIHAQYDIEVALHKLDPWVETNLSPQNLGAGMGSDLGSTSAMAWSLNWALLYCLPQRHSGSADRLPSPNKRRRSGQHPLPYP